MAMLQAPWLWIRVLLARVSAEKGAEVPEYVIVVAIIAMLAVVGLIAVKSGLLSNLNGIAQCLSSTASGSASSCS